MYLPSLGLGFLFISSSPSICNSKDGSESCEIHKDRFCRSLLENKYDKNSKEFESVMSLPNDM